MRDANALIILRRTAFVPEGTGAVELPPEAVQALMRWAQDHGLGQVEMKRAHQGSDFVPQMRKIVHDVARRRERALTQLRSQGKHVARVLLTPEWRIAVGLGEKNNAHEIGLTLHGTYGWPVIPGSGLKGVTAAHVYSRDEITTENRKRIREIFGSPRPQEQSKQNSESADQETDRAARGSVRFLDALATDGQVKVTVDVLTPHVKPYYDSTLTHREGEKPHPPAEHHQPVPVHFLTVSGGTFTADLVGDSEEDIAYAASCLQEAVEEQGVGAKTSAGYGYMTTRRGEM
ncbi:CRISPR-associated protein Cmr6 [Marinactinospora thermotolerans DSM 45154]|uniref:CRISPR-associated protein Cmr6 n=1 Tax=Marinactinospora thermotolerans DSM 45154 TaxID=1122192 RepID=A0A1T4S4N0_9ACTN|nr:type III-B CRISPR module RAMP protein Cmr6 [Marinactinospora thermotolerans]SKA23183.1 CRISPR-associated protein Cmr6 [Marinactinospora thermotolerans DSM 45154]